MEKTNKYSKFILYSYWRSSCAWRARIALNLKNIDYELKTVNIPKKEQRGAEYEKINPNKKVPALIFNQNDKPICLSESFAIIDFLDEAFLEPKLLPEDPILKAKARAICYAIAINIQPMQNSYMLGKIEEMGGDKLEFAHYFNEKGLESVEKMVTETRGKYCIGDNVTIADIFILPQLWCAKNREDVDINKYPNLLKIVENLKQLEAFKRADCQAQPDVDDT